MPGKTFSLRRRSSRIQSARAEMPAAFNAPFCTDDELDVLLRHYESRRDATTFDAVVEAFMPLVAALAMRMKKLRPEVYRDDIDQLVSDGLMGLLDSLRSFQTGMEARAYAYCAKRSIRSSIRNERLRRLPGGRIFNLRRNEVSAMRSRMTIELGRQPTKAELTNGLRCIIPNPSFYVEHESRQTQSLDDDANGHKSPLSESLPSNSRDPADILTDAGLMRIALKGMDAIDKRVFKMLMRGSTQIDIAKAMGVTRQRVGQRVTCLLWVLQRNAELAEHVGFKPAPTSGCGSSRDVIGLSKRTRVGTLLARNVA
jgi:RNA polymerase sigma factor (sigma-70 family)